MIDRLVYLLLAGCLGFGAVALSELASIATDDGKITGVTARPEAAPEVRRPQGPRLDDLLGTTLARPLFSSTRRPPQSVSTDGATESDLAGTRLTGIVTEPGRHIAIFAVNGAKPLRVTEGEAVSSWRIETITPREVSLRDPNGTKTLRPNFDPNLVPAPGPKLGATAGVRQPLPVATPPAANKGAPAPAPPTAAASQSAPGNLPMAIPAITSPGMPLSRSGRPGLRQ
jgi:hypothetical protein